MKPPQPSRPPRAAVPSGLASPSFRSGAVARMAQMPVATLRIWEQRYQAVRTATTASGHRLYSPADVQRVLLLRRLTEQGHAIGSIAALASTQLQVMTQEPAKGIRLSLAKKPAAALRLAVVGPALAARLQRPAVLTLLAPLVPRVAVFDSLAEVVRVGAEAQAVDLLLWHAPELQPELPPELQAAQRACQARGLAVVYRFASASATQALLALGATALREPADDAVLGAWLASLQAQLSTQRTARRSKPAQQPAARPAHDTGGGAPRRFDDAALTAIAGLPSTLACECPRHVAELLTQLASFEAYSADCLQRNKADMALHTHLHRVAGTARVLFESALEQVAHREGLRLP